MPSFNKVILMGNLTRDPDLRYTPKGTAVARITVAVNRTWRTETGELREEATFVDVDAYSKQAELIAKYFKKGNPILVEGRLRQHSWEDKQTNQKRSVLRVELDSFSFVGPAPVRENGIEPERTVPTPNNNQLPTSPPPEPPDEDDSVPF